MRAGIPGVEYMCEHPGFLGTHSIAGRVRYRGLLKDPNELAWAVGLGVPFAFALYELQAIEEPPGPPDRDADPRSDLHDHDQVAFGSADLRRRAGRVHGP